MKKLLSFSCCLVVPLLLGSCGNGGNVCSVGQKLAPDQSCEMPDVGTFSVRADGCLGEVPALCSMT